MASRAGTETLLKISRIHRFWLSRKRQIAVSGTLLLSCPHLAHKTNVFLLFYCLSSTNASQIHVKSEKVDVKRQLFWYTNYVVLTFGGCVHHFLWARNGQVRFPDSELQVQLLNMEITIFPTPQDASGDTKCPVIIKGFADLIAYFRPSSDVRTLGDLVVGGGWGALYRKKCVF